MEEIKSFKEKFRMLRKDEPGLSILIPYPQESLLDAGALARAVLLMGLQNYQGSLVVNIRIMGFLSMS